MASLLSVFDAEIVRIAALSVAHDVRDGLGRGSFEDPMAVVVKQAVAVDADVVQGGVSAHVGERLYEVLGIEIDPLAAPATLGNRRAMLLPRWVKAQSCSGRKSRGFRAGLG